MSIKMYQVGGHVCDSLLGIKSKDYLDNSYCCFL